MWNFDEIPRWQPKVARPAADVKLIQTQAPETTAALTSEPIAVLKNAVPLGDLHGAIEHLDAEGQRSVRTITMKTLGNGPYAPITTAICHSRRAVRHLRTDRIVNSITSDGEVMTTVQFFLEVLRIDLKDPIDQDQPESFKIAKDLRNVLRPAISHQPSAFWSLQPDPMPISIQANWPRSSHMSQQKRCILTQWTSSNRGSGMPRFD